MSGFFHLAYCLRHRYVVLCANSLFPFCCWVAFHYMDVPQMVFHHLMDLGLFPAWGYFEKSAMNICIHRESFFCLSKVMDQFWLLLHPALIPRRIYSSCYLPLSFVCLFVDLGFLLLLLFSRSVVSDSLWPRGLQHARFPWPSLPTPRAYSNSCPLSQWCHPTILSSVVPCPLLLLLLSVFPSISVFPNESVLHIRCPKY